MEVRSEAEGERVRSEADEDAARSDSRAADDRRVDLAPQQNSIGHETLSTEGKRQGSPHVQRQPFSQGDMSSAGPRVRSRPPGRHAPSQPCP
jgi:hypothetical protein